jgi:hypothetical protein
MQPIDFKGISRIYQSVMVQSRYDDGRAQVATMQTPFPNLPESRKSGSIF